MFLDTVSIIKEVKIPAGPALVPEPVYAAWQHFPYTCFLHHNSRCCQSALAWLTGMDRSRLYGESLYAGPRWLRSVYDWGPMTHPTYWCEALRMKILDCGGQAVVAREVFRARGLAVFPLQIVQQYNQDNVAHWRCSWEEKDCDAHWINGVWIYHEGCGILLPDGSLKLWDATSSCWLDPLKLTGYGSIAAVKVSNPQDAFFGQRTWGPHLISENTWVALGPKD